MTMRPGIRLGFLFLAVLPGMAALAEGGHVFKGNVYDLEGAPISQAMVWVYQDRGAQETRTDAEGRFSFSGLETGFCEAVVYREGYGIGGHRGFLMEDVEAPIVLGTPGLLRMRVVSNTFLPVPGARVIFMAVNDLLPVRVDELSELGFPVLRSGDDGLIDIDFLPEGGFAQLVLSHVDFADTQVAYLPVREEAQDIILYPGLTVRGRVSHDGKGIPRARVSMYRPGVGGERYYADVLTDPEGFYSARAPRGEYLLRVRHPDWGMSAPQSILLDHEAETAVADFALPTPQHIEGSVLFPDGKPCGGVQVVYRSEGVPRDETWTNRAGVFRIKAPSPQGLLRIVPPPGFMTESLSEIPVDLGDSREVRLRPVHLEPLPEIMGVIVDDTGIPAYPALVSSLDPEHQAWALTDAEGRFSLRLGYMPETGELTFRAEHGLRFLRKDFTVQLKPAKPLEIQLETFQADLTHGEDPPGRNRLTPLIDKEAPEIDCEDWFNTQPLDLGALRGKVVVLTFWGGFDNSLPGINRIEELRALHALFHGVEDVVILGIHDTSSDADEVEEYVHQYRIEFPVGRDAEPFVTFVNYGINFIPQTLLIDKRGIVRYVHTDGRLPELIKALRRETTAPATGTKKTANRSDQSAG
jgi:peroxiredoxin